MRIQAARLASQFFTNIHQHYLETTLLLLYRYHLAVN